MRVWQGILLVVLLMLVPVLSACDLLGVGGDQQRQRDYYEEQLKAVQKQREAYQKQQEAYYEARNKALKEYEEAYKLWWEQQQKQRLEQFKQPQADNQTDNQTQQ